MTAISNLVKKKYNLQLILEQAKTHFNCNNKDRTGKQETALPELLAS